MRLPGVALDRLGLGFRGVPGGVCGSSGGMFREGLRNGVPGLRRVIVLGVCLEVSGERYKWVLDRLGERYKGAL